MADAGAFCTNLSELCCPEVASIYRYSGRAFGAAIAFKRPDSEPVFKCDGNSLGSFSAPAITYCRLPKSSGEQRRVTTVEMSALPRGK